MPEKYLLDTNIFVHLVRNDPVGSWIIQRYRLLSIQPIPAYSIVTAGEILSLAIRARWGSDKFDHLEFLLDYFECQYVDNRKFADGYAVLDSSALDAGIKMGKNDLWIAAAAYASNLVLLTADREFDFLATGFIRRDWIDPNQAGIT